MFRFNIRKNGTFANAKNLQIVAGFCVVGLMVGLAGAAITPDVARADSTVGNGTASSCTSTALFNAFTTGGNITFNCGSGSVTIYLNTQIIVNPNGGGSSTTVDGGGLITIDGSMSSLGIFYVNPNSSFVMKNLTLANAKVVGADGSGGSNSGSAGGDGGSVQGAALTSFGTSVSIINSTFRGNSIVGGNGGNGTSANNGKFGQNGGNGGTAQGAAIYNDSGTLNISSSTFQNNNVTGGVGGNGGPNNDGGSGSTNGKGGNGGNAQGSAIYNNSGTVSISGSSFQTDVATGGQSGQGGGSLHSGISGVGGVSSGGAIFNNSGALTITTSTFTANNAIGGNGAVGVVPVVYDSAAGGNGGDAFGGAILSNSGSSNLNIGNSTFNNNSTTGGQGGTGGMSSNAFNPGAGGSGGKAFGGAIASLNSASTFSLYNSTLTANTATGGTGGTGGNGNSNYANVYNGNGGTGGNAFGGSISGGGNLTKITNVTLASNGAYLGTGGMNGAGGHNGTVGANGIAGGGNANLTVGSSLTNSLVANPTAGGGCAGTFTDGGNNLEFPGNSCGFSVGNHDLLSDPRLSLLANNGGPTQTIALLNGSPAIDAGNFSICAASPINNKDQRDQTRLVGTSCDIGAYEYSPTSISSNYTYYLPLVANNATTPVGQTTTYVTLQNLASSASASITIQYYGLTTGTSSFADSITIPAKGQRAILPGIGAGKSGDGIITSNQPLNVVVSEAVSSGGSAYAVTGLTAATLYSPIALNGAFGGFTTNIIIFNTGSTASTGQIRFYDASGNVAATQSFSINAHASQTLSQAGVSGLSNSQSYWAKISATNTTDNLTAQVIEFGPNNFVATFNASVPTQAASILYAPAAFNGLYGYVTGMGFANPNPTAANVTVTYYDANGVQAGSKTLSIAANGNGSLFQGAAGTSANLASAVVTSSQPLVMTVNERGTNNASGTYVGIASGSTSVALPVVANGFAGFVTGATIFNAGSGTANLTLTYLDGNGVAVGNSQTTTTLAPNASYGLYQGAASQGLNTSYFGTALISSNQPLIVTTNALQNGTGLFYTYTEPSN